MKLALIQTDIIWEDKVRNLERIGGMISSVPGGTGLVILPEMFNTGFSMNPVELAEPPQSVTSDWMKDIAAEFNFGICGSYIVSENSKFYNRWIFVSPDGEVRTYDKRHLFSISGEEALFTRGEKRVVINFMGIRICPNVCYDLRFPVWSRNRNDYDLLINSANWPESRRDVWITLLKARALENQCFVAGVNRIGIDGAGIRYCGDSMILGPKGEMIAEGKQNEESIVSGDISIDELSGFRRRFPVWKDGDNFEIC